jgi:hypothetical protein
MRKTLLAAIFISLLISSFFVSSATADNIIITIKGGFGCVISITNNGNETIKANMSWVAKTIFRDRGGDAIGNDIPIKSGETFLYKGMISGLNWISASANVGNHVVSKKGISIFNFVILFNAIHT